MLYKISTRIAACFPVILFCLTSFAQDVMGTWSGTMTLHSKGKTITGSFEKKIKLVITDNKVTATHEGTEECTVMGSEGSSTCKGAGPGELWRLTLNQDGTYDIEAFGPALTCIGTVHRTGQTVTGQSEPHSLTVSSKPINNNPNVLGGSHTDQFDNYLGSGFTTTTWNLVRSSGVELIVVPIDYDTWLPVPGKDELTKGSVMPIALKVQKIGGGPSPLKAKKFEIKLSGTSTEPGITINLPLQPLVDDELLPDLRLLPAASAKINPGAQELSIDCNCLTATVMLAAFDGGGFSTLTAEALLEDNTVVKGHLFDSQGETDILIPKRDPGSNIAKSWLDAHGNPAETDDLETLVNKNHPGDGLTVYEEYRGVISEGKFKRLDPQKMELGVWIKKTELPLFVEGMNWFEKGSGVQVIKFIDDEINETRILNKNFKTAHDMVQFVEKLEKGNLPGDVIGENQPADVIFKLPSQSKKVVIDVDKIKKFYRLQSQTASANGIRLPYTEQEDLANTVAHELAHGVNVNHHGYPSAESDSVVINESRFIRIFDSHKKEISDRPYTIRGNIGTQHNDESGDLSCFMAYTSLYQWVKLEVNGDLEYHALWPLPVGKTMCNTQTGDSKNLNFDNKYFGSARFGNCREQIQLR